MHMERRSPLHGRARQWPHITTAALSGFSDGAAAGPGEACCCARACGVSLDLCALAPRRGAQAVLLSPTATHPLCVLCIASPSQPCLVDDGRRPPVLAHPARRSIQMILPLSPTCVSRFPGWLPDGRRSMAGWVREPYLVRMSLPIFVIRSRYSSP